MEQWVKDQVYEIKTYVDNQVYLAEKGRTTWGRAFGDIEERVTQIFKEMV